MKLKPFFFIKRTRLYALPPTPDDVRIRMFRIGRQDAGFAVALSILSRDADIYDGELMLDLACTRAYWIGRWLIRGRNRRALLAYQSIHQGSQ